MILRNIEVLLQGAIILERPRLEPDAVQDSCAQVLDCSSGNASGVGSGQSDNHVGAAYPPIMTHALLREWDRAQAPSSSAERKAMLKRIFLAIFAGAGTPLVDDTYK